MVTKTFVELAKFEIVVGFEEYDDDQWSDVAIDDLIEELMTSGIDPDPIKQMLEQITVGTGAVFQVTEV